MWSSGFNTIILYAVMSFITILIGQHLWEYMKNSYSQKRTRNLVEIQTEKYKHLLEDMQKADANDSGHLGVSPPLETTYLNETEKEWMLKELEAYLSSA
jgi:hypothetical protein